MAFIASRNEIFARLTLFINWVPHKLIQTVQTMIPIIPHKIAILNSILNITVRNQLHTFSLIISRNHVSLTSNAKIWLSLRG